MKKLMLSMTAAVAVAVCSAGESEQERSWPWSPVGVGIAAPLQIPWTDSDVLGLRFGGFFGRIAGFGSTGLFRGDFGTGRGVRLRGGGVSGIGGGRFFLRAGEGRQAHDPRQYQHEDADSVLFHSALLFSFACVQLQGVQKPLVAVVPAFFAPDVGQDFKIDIPSDGLRNH